MVGRKLWIGSEFLKLVIAIFLFQHAFAGPNTRSTRVFKFGTPLDPSTCSLSPKTVYDIMKYQAVADQIFVEATQLSFKGKTYGELALFVDTFGPRLAGTAALEKSIDYVVREMKKAGLDNIVEERVTFPGWSRGTESLTMLRPRNMEMLIFGAGNGVETPFLGILAEAIVISSFDYARQHPEEIFGKIVVVNIFCIICVPTNATVLENAGALAIVTRSFVKNSRYTLAVGTNGYKPTTKLPLAYATNEDVDLMARLSKQGKQIKLYLKLLNAVQDSSSRNVMGDLTGTEKPSEIVIVNGHTDSWDVAQAAQDDGFGVILSLQVPRLLQYLNLFPRRTIRSLFTTAEELGLFGAVDYVRRHKRNLRNLTALVVADWGCFQPIGFRVDSNSRIGCVLAEVLKLVTERIGGNSIRVARTSIKDVFSDALSFIEAGVPSAIVDGDNGQFFEYHHTRADTVVIANSTELDKCLGLLATTAYILADMNESVGKL